MYSGAYNRPGKVDSSKVDTVCTALQETMDRLDQDR